MDIGEGLELFLARFRSIVASLEVAESPLYYTFFAFYGVLTVRIFTEVLATRSVINWEYFFHWYLHWSFIVVFLTLFLHRVTKTSMEKVARVVLPASVVFLIPPILGSVFSLGKALDITYILPGQGVGLSASFLTLLGEAPGINLAMRLQILLILASVFTYIYLKRQKIYLAIASTLVIYFLIFLVAITPIIVKTVLNFMGYSYIYSPMLMAEFYLILGFPTGLLTYSESGLDLETGEEVWKLIFLQLAFWVGVILAGRIEITDAVSLLSVILSSVAISLLWLFWEKLREVELRQESLVLGVSSIIYTLPAAGASLPFIAGLAGIVLNELPPFQLERFRKIEILTIIFVLFAAFCTGFLTSSEPQALYRFLSLR